MVTNSLYVTPSPSVAGNAINAATVDRTRRIWASGSGGLGVHAPDGGITTVPEQVSYAVMIGTGQPPGIFSAAYATRSRSLLQVRPDPPAVNGSEMLPLPLTDDVSVPLAVDCRRDLFIATTVVLYISSSTALTTVLVPGRTLDPLSPWPRWQYDQYQSGNPSLRLPTGCP